MKKKSDVSLMISAHYGIGENGEKTINNYVLLTPVTIDSEVLCGRAIMESTNNRKTIHKLDSRKQQQHCSSLLVLSQSVC